MLERRDSPRVRADDEGLILVAGRQPMACRLANRSGSGVWLWVPAGNDVPDSFRVKLPATGEAMHLDVVWRRPTEIAARIAFEIAPDPDFAMPLAA
jgi:hypothetical protein